MMKGGGRLGRLSPDFFSATRNLITTPSDSPLSGLHSITLSSTGCAVTGGWDLTEDMSPCGSPTRDSFNHWAINGLQKTSFDERFHACI